MNNGEVRITPTKLKKKYNNYSLKGSLQKFSFLFINMFSLSCACVYIDDIHLIHIIIKRLTGLSC